MRRTAALLSLLIAAPAAAQDAPSGAVLPVTTTVTGACERLVLDGTHRELECDGTLVWASYFSVMRTSIIVHDGRGNVLASFHGTYRTPPSMAVSHGLNPTAGVFGVDEIVSGTPSADLESHDATGFCSLGDLDLGAATVACQGVVHGGAPFVLHFRTDGAAPVRTGVGSRLDDAEAP